MEQRTPFQAVGVLCRLFGYSRQAYYQHLKTQHHLLQEHLLLQEVMRIRRDQKRMGARKLLVLLAPFMTTHRIELGRDTFFELLRRYGLLVKKRKRLKPQTTFSGHWLRKYDNLTIGFVPRAAGQLWVSDITYIHLEEGFAYLSLVTDAYSRKIMGFYLSEDLAARGCIQALEMALTNYPVPGYLIHHSDRGIQYCCQEYIQLLCSCDIRISMTNPGDPGENALAERINRTIKDEFNCRAFLTFDLAKTAITKSILVYNQLRPHASCDYLTPNQAHLREGLLKKRWRKYKRKNPINQELFIEKLNKTYTV